MSAVKPRWTSRYWKLAAAFPLLQFGGCVSSLLEVLDDVIANAFVAGFDAVGDNVIATLGG